MPTKRLSFVAVLCLLCLTHGAAAADSLRGNSDSPAVSSAGTTGPVPPAGAQAAGFTTLAYNGDFSRRLPTNWLGGCPGGPNGSQNDLSDDAGHIWWNNLWWSNSHSPCTISQVTDSTYRGRVLDIPWTVNNTAPVIGHIIQSASWNYNGAGKGAVGISFPNNAYYEATTRISPVQPGAFTSFIT